MLKELYSYMLKYNFKPNHKLDQNFIINKSVVEKVLDLLEEPKDNNSTILEVGPGTGFLTKELLKKYNKVIVIEKDPKMIDILKKELDTTNIEFINEDFLKVDLNKIKFDQIVSFIPYSISQQFLDKLNKTTVQSVIVVQKEFAEKLISIAGFENYNTVSVLAQTYFDVKYIKKIGRKSFFPEPKCESAIVLLKPRNPNLDINYNLFVKTIFRYSNKDLSNALKLSSKAQKNESYIKNIEKVDKDLLNLKVKQLEIEEIKEVYNSLMN